MDRTLELFESLSPEEQKSFNFDVTRINWRHYIQNVHIPGVKKFILKIEGAGTMELASPAALPVSTINELIDRSSDAFGERVALQIAQGDTWKRYSYRDLQAQALDIGSHLHAHGLRKGDRVVLYSENHPDWGVAYLGAVRAGLVVVPLDAQTWRREVWSVCAFTGAKAILSSRACFSRLSESELFENESSSDPVLLLNLNDRCQVFAREDLPKSCPSVHPEDDNWEPPEVGPEDPASIIFTTGTMVDPRGAVHTHRNFLANLFGVHTNLPIRTDDSMLSVLPLYHALEFTCGFLMPIFGGARVTYATTLKPRVILETMRETGTTCMLGVPTLYALLRDYLERTVLGASKSSFRSNLMVTSKQISRSVQRRFGRNIGRQLFSKVHQELGGRIRVLVSGGSALGEDLFEDYRALGTPIYEGYGLTETAPVLTVNPMHRARSRSAGRPLPGVEVRLDHPDKHGIGEIVVRSPSLMKEYYRNNAATRAVMEDDWFHTGDLGWVDIDGYIYITGRVKDVIVTGAGKNVYPMDLEAIYRDVPGVSQIGVVGLPKGLTEEVHAVIVPDPDDEVTAAAIRERIRGLARELPSYHRLQQIHFWSEDLPRAPDGALDRAALRRLLLRQLKESNALRQPTPRKTSSREVSLRDVLVAELSRLSGADEESIEDSTDIYEELGLDSLQAIELLLFAEEHFKVAIPDERAASLTKVSQLLQLVEDPAVRPRESREPVLSSTLPVDERSALDRILLRSSFSATRMVLRSCFDLRVANGDAIPAGQPYILAANHSSHLDTGAVIAALMEIRGMSEALRLHVLGARDYFFGSKARGWLVSKFLNVVPIERQENSLASLRLVRKILSSGEAVLIFPEGTRSRDGQLQNFKAGLGLIAWEMQVPIIPVAIVGTHAALPPGKVVPTRQRVRLAIGDPISMSRYREQFQPGSPKDEIYRSISSDIRDVIEKLQKTLHG